eukprot:3879715-Pleurochrysis_carterae.AAC.2
MPVNDGILSSQCMADVNFWAACWHSSQTYICVIQPTYVANNTYVSAEGFRRPRSSSHARRHRTARDFVRWLEMRAPLTLLMTCRLAPHARHAVR